ncbi:Nucleoporin [Phytophthora megakarya]|uniref:Nucleoporin n=1 Tax=Phytophthora megakarya TaxID=4795 RepID=A0A225VL83_9STRA|nr:Nucleoporin [Phytophthora megakarya]
MIKIWEEHGRSGDWSPLCLNASYATDSGNPTATDSKEGWRNQAQLVDARDSATASEDGFVRMYEAIDVMNPSHWPLQEEFLADKDGVTCVSWNKSRFDVLMIVVGRNSNVAKIWDYNNSYRRWQVLSELVDHANAIHDVSWAPNMDRSSHLLAAASKDRTEDDHLQAYVDEAARKHHQDSEVWQVEWKVTRVLASSGGVGTVRMWKSDFEGNWACVNTIC